LSCGPVGEWTAVRWRCAQRKAACAHAQVPHFRHHKMPRRASSNCARARSAREHKRHIAVVGLASQSAALGQRASARYHQQAAWPARAGRPFTALPHWGLAGTLSEADWEGAPRHTFRLLLILTATAGSAAGSACCIPILPVYGVLSLPSAPQCCLRPPRAAAAGPQACAHRLRCLCSRW
jgi:hypothetical protein